MDQNTKEIYESVLTGAMEETGNKVQNGIDAGLPADLILKKGLIAAMGEVGQLFEQGEYFVPEMLISAKSMKSGLDILRPHLVAADVKPIGKVIIGTVQGDLHDIGKNLVGMMLEGVGFEVIDMGVDVKPEELVEMVKEHKPDIVAMSALLTTTMENIKTALRMMDDSGVLKDVKVMIGGAPVTQEYSDALGVEGFGRDASQAARIAISLVQ